jgi:hypothetical protein
MKRNPLKIILISLLTLLVILLLGFYIYTLDYSHADSRIDNLSSSSNIQIDNNITIITPNKSSDIGLIFYPGGKVEAKAYLPLLEKISKTGITCYLVEMPLNLAVFNINAATKIIKENTKINKWYLAGHSLGGAMASSYAKDNYSKLEGLLLLAAYPLNDAPIDTLCLYGSFDTVLDQSTLDNILNKYEIIGGNHSYFGNYGEQKGDGVATITRDRQQEITVNKFTEFINK